jgi:SAM-dependent methyltransferase
MNPVIASIRSHLTKFDRNDSVRDRAVATWAAALPLGTRILDVGAGSCKYASLFAHCEYLAQDHPDVAYAPAKAVIRSDITKIPLPDASLDALLCTEVLEHVEAPLDAVVEFARLLRPGGRLMLTVPLASRIHRVPTHFYGGLGPDFFECSLTGRGFHLDELRPLGSWTQFMAQELGRTPSVLRDSFDLPQPLREALFWVSWPLFRLVLPATFLLMSNRDRSADLPFGWLAYATRDAFSPAPSLAQAEQKVTV